MAVQIIATIGPGSLKKNILDTFKQRGVDFIRVNLSHTKIEDLDNTLKIMKKSGIEVVIDTEGSQIRTGYLGTDTVTFAEGDRVRVYDYPVRCTPKQMYIRPTEALSFLEVGSLISIDFNSVLLKVVGIKKRDQLHYVQTVVLVGGVVGNNKAITIDSISSLPPFSQKDIQAIAVAKKNKVRYFTLSFMDNAEEVKTFKKLYPQAIKISKIETKQGVLNFAEILRESEGILIDRGDLSREIPGERIPIAQKVIIHQCNAAKKPVFVATNVLESMSEQLKPMKSEINDVVNTILDGVNGLVLTKESAVGKHPVETVNALKTIIAHTESARAFSKTKDLSYFTEPKLAGALVEPHGGTLVDRYRVVQFSKPELKTLKKIDIDEEVLMDVEQIAFGAFSPLEGFVTARELDAILGTMRLPNGLPWTMPIVLAVSKKELDGIGTKEHVALVRKQDGKIYATLEVHDIYKVDKSAICKKWFGTDNREHPGVDRVFRGGDYFIGGKVNLLERRPSDYKDYELTPAQTRKIFQEKGWSVVVGFHTRNAIHRSHEYIQLKAMERVSADGLFVHPVVGKKKKGDFEARIIIRSYELMMKKFYPKNRVIMGVYPTFSRYAGPREAIFTALCRKNYGCSHFVVGRDHTGVGEFYSPWASHEIFQKFPDLGIEPVTFKKVYYSEKQGKHIHEGEDTSDPESEKQHISGTQLRKMFIAGQMPPDWFMREDIAMMIREEIEKGSAVFV